MNREWPNLETGNSAAGFAAAAAAAKTPRYFPPAPLADVMIEQIEYLLSHRGSNCRPGCADCARLSGVEALLLRPFLG
jgi:hypothetical protein